MKAASTAEKIVYLLVVLLCLAILVLVYISPADFMNAQSVYRGF
jgi:hypothetical protein